VHLLVHGIDRAAADRVVRLIEEKRAPTRSAGRSSAVPNRRPNADHGSAHPTNAVSARRLRCFSGIRDDHTPGSRIVRRAPRSSPANGVNSSVPGVSAT
jgi:hypothetical protein